MSAYEIVWHPRARDQLLALYDWIADRANAETAFSYTAAIEEHVGNLTSFPKRGTPRDDIMPGIRTTPWRRRTVIAYRVVDTKIEILALAHGGQLLDGAFDE